MDKASFFIENKAIFGSYPSEGDVEELDKIGVRYYVNLTVDGEKKIKPYETKRKCIRYPIYDDRTPSNIYTFCGLIIYIIDIIKNLKNNEKIYIHCKAGVSRSGMVVACILSYMNKINPAEAISLTTKYHRERKGIKDRLRNVTAPRTRSQKHFVCKLFRPLYIYNINNLHNDYIEDIVYNNKIYTSINKALNDDKNVEMLCILLYIKFSNENNRKVLLSSCFRPLIYFSNSNNMLISKILHNFREYYLKEIFSKQILRKNSIII